MLKNHWKFFVLFILIVVIAFIRFHQGIVQQDNYIGYAEGLSNGFKNVSFSDSRLFPGLPLVISFFYLFTKSYVLSGYFAVFSALIGLYFLLYKITNSKLSVIPLIFPPVLLNLASLIDTELPFMFLILLSLWFLKNRKLSLAFLIIGLTVWFRLAGLAVIFGVFLYFAVKKDLKTFLINFPYFTLPVVLLMIYNTHFFGSGNPFFQIIVHGQPRGWAMSFGVAQLGLDLVRAFRWHWFRILLSGIFYIILYTWLWARGLKQKSLEFWIITGIYIFTLAYDFVPFLENLGRYLAPTIPLFWLMFHNNFKSEKWLYFLLPISIAVVLI